MTIESTQVVYLVAPAGTGKSFSGDYLQVVHGYKHVDGDIPIKSMIIPKYRQMIKERIATNGKSPSYYEEIAKLTLDAAKDHDRVVLTHATYYQESRDVVIDTLVDGGICRDNITVIQLIIDPVVKLRCLYHRMKRQFEHKGKTIEDMFKHLQYEGNELTEEKFIKAMMEQHNGDMAPNGIEFEDCPMAKKVDVSDRVAHLSNLDEALGLTRSSESKDWTYETICAQVIPIDVQRDEESKANGSWDMLMELLAKRKELQAAASQEEPPTQQTNKEEAPTQQASKEETKQRREESVSSEDKQIKRSCASSSWEMGRTKSWEDCNWEDYVEEENEKKTELSNSFVSTPAA